MATASQTSKLLRAGLALAGALIAVIVLAALLHTRRFDPATARPDPAQTVKVNIYRLGGAPLHKGDLLRSTDAISVTFDNPRVEAVQLVLFGVDTNGAAHWYVPLDRNGRRDETSKGLPPTQGEHGVLGPTAIGNIPPGPFTFVALVNPGVIQLDRMDAFSPEERTPQGLRERFPDAAVLTWPVQVYDPEPPSGGP
jgi:hypothetical protein